MQSILNIKSVLITRFATAYFTLSAALSKAARKELGVLCQVLFLHASDDPRGVRRARL